MDFKQLCVLSPVFRAPVSAYTAVYGILCTLLLHFIMTCTGSRDDIASALGRGYWGDSHLGPFSFRPSGLDLLKRTILKTSFLVGPATFDPFLLQPSLLLFQEKKKEWWHFEVSVSRLGHHIPPKSLKSNLPPSQLVYMQAIA